MKWRPVSGAIAEADRVPYLLRERDRDRYEKALNGAGFTVCHVDMSRFRSEREASLAVARALGFPDFYRGGWDGFFDLLVSEFQERPDRIAVCLTGADELAQRDLRLFVHTSWQLQGATETIASEGEGAWQLEFLYWGQDWGSPE
ncbi:barstar family protein [Streptomyces sp. NPDC058740]|uniref:barstar family protein n=1 Tax=Streptomyces sp. NPDC058740 TaxID=3346619 RepID=UPI0036B54296